MQNIDYNTNVSNETKSNIRMILNSTTLIAISFFLLKAIKHLFKFSLQILILSKSIITLIIIITSTIFLFGQITNKNTEIDFINFLIKIKSTI
jgi:hypothetical protein